jgi:hypothetical protein
MKEKNNKLWAVRFSCGLNSFLYDGLCYYNVPRNLFGIIVKEFLPSIQLILR